MEAVLLFIIPMKAYIIYKLFFSDLRPQFEKDEDLHKEGVLLFKNRFYQDSLKYFNTHKNSKSALVSYYIAYNHLQLQNYHQALYHIENAAAYNETNHRVFALKGEILSVLKKYEEAARSYDKARAMNIKEPDHSFKAGKSYLNAGFKKVADERLKEAALGGHEEANYLLYTQKRNTIQIAGKNLL